MEGGRGSGGPASHTRIFPDLVPPPGPVYLATSCLQCLMGLLQIFLFVPIVLWSVSFGLPINIDMTAVIGMMNVPSYLAIGSVWARLLEK